MKDLTPPVTPPAGLTHCAIRPCPWSTGATMHKQIPKEPHPQQFKNGEVHDWYRIVLGYSDHLVSDLLDELDLNETQARLLDPFCGAGTTLVEAKKRGIRALGLDANPSSCFASSVKTDWNLNPESLVRAASAVGRSFDTCLADKASLKRDPTYRYISASGMLERGWISHQPLLAAMAAKQAVLKLRKPHDASKPPLLLALMAEFVLTTSNVKFGPELYCSTAKKEVDVLSNFRQQVERMASDIYVAEGGRDTRTEVLLGDARKLHTSERVRKAGLFDAVICSPPYPTEHDYTRNARLELAFLEQVSDIESLRTIKKRMLRSHTKGIYVSDSDSSEVSWSQRIGRIANQIKELTPPDAHGFARLYPTVLRQYFGGMAMHFKSVQKVLRRKARCMYIVGDQASYFGVHIPTAEILGSIAERSGFDVLEIRKWRMRRPTNGRDAVAENILILRRR